MIKKVTTLKISSYLQGSLIFGEESIKAHSSIPHFTVTFLKIQITVPRSLRCVIFTTYQYLGA